MSSYLPLNIREFTDIVVAWGFEHARSSGGHEIYTHPDHEMPRPLAIPGLGRKVRVPKAAATVAAQAVGVSVPEFLSGPTRSNGAAMASARAEEVRSLAAAAAAIQDEVRSILPPQPIALPDPTKETTMIPSPAAPAKRSSHTTPTVYRKPSASLYTVETEAIRWLLAHDLTLHLGEFAETITDLDQTQVGQRLATLAARDDSPIVRVRIGQYTLDESKFGPRHRAALQANLNGAIQRAAPVLDALPAATAAPVPSEDVSGDPGALSGEVQAALDLLIGDNPTYSGTREEIRVMIDLEDEWKRLTVALLEAHRSGAR